MRGYVVAPATGNCTFHVSGDDSCQLWLSPSDSQFAKKKIAFIDGYTNLGQWNKFGTQASTAIPLVAGRKYYIEALQKEAAGADHLKIGWKTPGSTSTIIPAITSMSHGPSPVPPGRSSRVPSRQ